MKAVLDLTRIPNIPAEGDSLEAPPCFFPILGKPVLQHLIETLEQQGCRELIIYLFDHAEKIEQFVGDGTRWGVTVTYVLISRQKDLLSRIKNSPEIADDELFVFGNALVLPQFPEGFFSSESGIGLIDAQQHCLQWAMTDKDHILSFDISSTDPTSPFENQAAVSYLSVRTGKEYLASVKKALDKEYEGLIIIGQEVRSGVWIGPGVRVPKSTTLVPPVYINQQTMIGEEDIIGPYAEIGKGCVIDDGSFITESAIFDFGYVGKQLDVKRSVINRKQIYHADIGTVYRASDDILLTDTESSSREDRIPKAPLLSRVLAALLFLLFLPLNLVVLLVRLMSKGRTWFSMDYVLLPQRAPEDGSFVSSRIVSYIPRKELSGKLYRHFLFILLPGLLSVVFGKVRFCGLIPRTPEEIREMSPEWREQYLRSHTGLITEADILYRDPPPEEMLYASDIFYRVHDSKAYNMKMVGSYLARLFSDDKRM